MNYQETLDFLFEQLPMYQRVGKSAFKKDLNNTLELLSSLDNPDKKFKTIHIAGTNGKGTSAHALAAILQSAGYKTGLYTSPHLKNFTERIKMNGVEVDESFIVDFVNQIRPQIESIRPSFFEITVVMAFQYFAIQEVDIAVIETGLGGRLDSTNVIKPEVSLITNIGMDHTDLLGDTLEKIATEKAGIIKEGIPVVMGSKQEEVLHVFEEKADEMNADLIVSESETEIPLSEDLPYHKMENLPGVIGVVQELRKKGWKIGEKDVATGVQEMEVITGFKGRYQILEESPVIIADVSHNKEGLKLLFSQIDRMDKRRLFVIFGTVRDKSYEPILNTLPKDAIFIWTQSSVPRSLPVSDLEAITSDFGLEGISFHNVNEAISYVRRQSTPEDLILITGSTFIIAEIKDL